MYSLRKGGDECEGWKIGFGVGRYSVYNGILQCPSLPGPKNYGSFTVIFNLMSKLEEKQ